MRDDVADVAEMRRPNAEATFTKEGQDVSNMVENIGDEIKPRYSKKNEEVVATYGGFRYYLYRDRSSACHRHFESLRSNTSPGPERHLL